LASLNAELGPTLLLGFEEPELYQHPPQAQHISNLLEHLANNKSSNTQIVVSTHSPYFVSSKGFENVRVVRKHYVDKCSLVASTTYAKVEKTIADALGAKPGMIGVTIAKIEQIMQPSQKELFFSRVAVLVEGQEDIGYIATHLMLKDQWREFRRLGCHFIVTGGKTNLSRPLAIATELCIRSFAVFDSDTDQKNADEHKRDNSCILRLCGIKEFDPMPVKTAIFENCVMFSPRIGDVVKDEADELWGKACEKVGAAQGLYQGANIKNKLFVAAVMEELSKLTFVSPLLTELCDRILAFAEKPIEEPVIAANYKITVAETQPAHRPASGSSADANCPI
jgi:predicted ATP-dependent endonuclease of OLD family